MADIATENYKKAAAKAVDRFNEKLAKIGKKLAPVLDELKKLSAVSKPSDDDKKRISELQKQEQDCEAAMDKAALELKLDLMLLDPPKNADPKEAKKLPAWLQEIIKKGGIPLGKDVVVTPDVDFDLKAMKLKKVLIKFTVPLP